MKWIHRGLQLGQAVKNVNRLRHILTVFARHGFDDIVYRINLGKYLPGSFKRKNKINHTESPSGEISENINSELDSTQDHLVSIPEKLRKALEELGPTFIKLGQLLSTRSDILPDEFIEELTKLQSEVKTIPFLEIKKVIEQEFKKPIYEIFSSINETPLASASIAQVHMAELMTGESVVVKVQRPGIRKIIETDISLLELIARLSEKYIPESKVFRPITIVDEFFRTLTLELDFRVEANNMEKIRKNFSDFDEIVIPKVFRQYTTEKILIQEKLNGIRLNDVQAITAAGLNKKELVKTGARAFFKSVLIDGLFHGDYHGGNLFALPENKLGIIDFGIVGRLSDRSKEQFAQMVLSLLSEDYENLCYQYAELGDAETNIDFNGFQRDLRNSISPYLGLNMNEVNSGKILTQATKIANHYGVSIPGDWMLVFKAMITVEGMGRTLDPDFDILEMSDDLVKDLVKNNFSYQKISKEILWIARDVSSLFRVLPRQIRWMFKKFNSNDFAFEIKIPNLEKISKEYFQFYRKRTDAFMSLGFLLIGTLALQYPLGPFVLQMPLITFIFYVLGLLWLLKALR